MFASKWEAELYGHLRLVVPARFLHLQPMFELLPAFKDVTGAKQRAIMYCADFLVGLPRIENAAPARAGDLVIDAKGMETTDFKLKRKMFLYRYGVPLLAIKKRKRDLAALIERCQERVQQLITNEQRRNDCAA